MYCKNCGSEIPDGANFCQVCGKKPTDIEPVTYVTDQAKRPDTYLALSVLVTLLCCLPFGVIGIIYAGKVDSSWNAGDYDAARTYSKKAKSWATWGVTVSIVLSFLMFMFYVIFGAAAVLNL